MQLVEILSLFHNLTTLIPRREIESRGVQEVGIYRVNGVDSEIRRLKSAFDESK